MNKYMKLGDIATFMNGYAFKPADWEEQGLPIIRIQNLTSDNKNFNYYNKNYDPKYEINKGDVLISWSASLGVYEWQGEKALLNQHIFKVVFDKIEVDKRFFIYAVKILLKNIENNLHGSTMKHITKPMFENLKFPVLSLEKQRKIADVLDCVSDILSMKKSQLNNVNKLTKFQFFKMFGDPILNEKNWKKVSCKEIISKIGSGSTPLGGNKNYKSKGISFIRSLNVHNNKFINDGLVFINEKQSEKLKNVNVEKDDILFNITGASVARSCIVPLNILPARVNQHVSIIRCNKEIIKPIFLCSQLTNIQYQSFLLKIAKNNGATREALTKEQLENLNIILPPIELQNKFADFVRQTEKCLFELQKSIDETQLLFDSLMDKYFS